MNTELQQQIAHQSALLLGNWLVNSGRMKCTDTEMDNEFTKRFLSAIERATEPLNKVLVEIHRRAPHFEHVLQHPSGEHKGYDVWLHDLITEVTKVPPTQPQRRDPRDVANFCAFLWHCGESTEDALFEHDAVRSDEKAKIFRALNVTLDCLGAPKDKWPCNRISKLVAEVRKPVVELILELRDDLAAPKSPLWGKFNDALAKVKQ